MTSKRLFDLAIAVPAGLVALPLVILLSVLIGLVDRQDPIFRQIRLGRNERPFTMYKLRTMRVGTDEAPTHKISASSVSKLGRFLRATKLDELPQLWSVIVGDMSLVGPRPGLTDHDELTQKRREKGVFSLVPGITGVSQIKKIDMSDVDVLAESDARYIGRDSIPLDLKIIWATIVGRGGGDRVAD